MDSPNALLKDLAREREERSNSSLKRQRQATNTCHGGGSSQPASSSSLATGEGEARVIVDLCDSDDDGAAEDPSLALARRLQAEEDLQHSRSLRSPGVSDQAYQASSSDPWPGTDDAALAERLQREEMAKLMGRRGRLVSLAPGSDAWYEAMTRDENRRRVRREGPT